MAYASMDELLAEADNPGEEFTAPSGRVFRIRSLTRGELMERVQGAAAIERHVLVCGMVDPPCTEEQAKQWQAAPAKSAASTDCGAVVEAIWRLSGFGEDAIKSSRRTDAAGPAEADGRAVGEGVGPDAVRDPGDAP